MAFEYLIGVDGGGTGTRVVVADAHGRELARASGAPSALGLGIPSAWQAIDETISRAFGDIGKTSWSHAACAIGLGLSGVHNAQWEQAFTQAAPGFAALTVATDGFTTLLGAHAGQPGAIVAVGTGIVGEAWFGGQKKHTVSAWGFPSGDEGSGAWIGLRAAQLAERALDGRAARGKLADVVIAYFGGTIDATFAWLGRATQTTFAQLAPLVLQTGADDEAAMGILHAAGKEIAAVAQALDPDAQLPIALCGGLADALRPWMPDSLTQRAQAPKSDSASGAIYLIKERVHG